MAALKTAIVGCGKIADGHVEELKKLNATDVVAVCDIEILMAEQLAVRYGIPRHYDDFERMLAETQPSVVHITTPPQSHLALATTAINAGCHVFVEKPFTMNYEESRQLIAAAEQKSRKLTVGYTYLFDPPALLMRRAMTSGALGDPIHVESFFGYDLTGVFGQVVAQDARHWVRELPGGLLHNNIDHVLNKVTEFIDEERPIVHAFARERDGSGSGVLDELRAIILGRRCSAYVTFSAHAKPVTQFVRVYGTRNTICVNYTNRTVTYEKAPGLPSAVGRLLPAFTQSRDYFKAGMKNVTRFVKSDFHFFAGLQNLMRLFYDSIQNNTAPPIPHRDILRISWLIDEIFRQTEQTTAKKMG